MYTLNHTYRTNDLLEKWIYENDLATKKESLIQFFCGDPREESMQNIASTLTNMLPNAHILGTTTDGEIIGDSVSLQSIVISVSIFEKSKLYSTSIELEKDSYDMGYKIANELHSDDVKAMILFTTGLEVNGERFLNGVKAISQNKYIVSGGLAGDNGEFIQTYVSHQNRVLIKGVVGVALCGEELNVINRYKFGWEAIGLPMTVTKCQNNRVYELNNTPIIDIYTKYFGKEISDLLPKIGVEIPLIIQRNNKSLARANLARFDDGSLLFGGDFKENEEVRFGLGNVSNILKNSYHLCNSESEECYTESIFIYSCMARRRLLQSQAHIELQEISKKATVSGFFTYGEFFSDEKDNYLMNETLTLLSLSESYHIEKEKKEEQNQSVDFNVEENKMMYAVTHMTNVMAKEWQERVEIETAKNKEQEKQSFQKNKLAQMGEMISMIAHQWRQPLNAISATGINLSLLSSMEMLNDEKVQESSEFIQEQTQKMSQTIDTFMNFVKPSKESKPFNLSHTIESIMQIMGTQLANHNIEVKITVKDDNISMVGYEDLLEQVLINLLSNSRDAFESLEIPSKFINITLDMKSDIPIVVIEDNAGGIPKETSEKIFNPYFTTKEQGKGTGIGLFMSLDIMKKSFNGNLKYSAIENGSCFTIVCGGGRK